jgi:hypothetical protein
VLAPALPSREPECRESTFRHHARYSFVVHAAMAPTLLLQPLSYAKEKPLAGVPGPAWWNVVGDSRNNRRALDAGAEANGP